MSHLKVGPLDLGHGPIEGGGQEVLEVADPTQAASSQTESTLRRSFVPGAVIGAAYSDALDFHSERSAPGGSYPDIASQAATDVQNAADTAVSELLPWWLAPLIILSLLALLASAFGRLLDINVG